MAKFKTTRTRRAKRRRKRLLLFLVVALPLVYYLYFFVIWSNFREVVPQKVYRSAQPTPAQLRKWISRYGIKTVINLRGHAGKVTDDEQAAVDALGIKMVTIRFKSSSLPTRDSLDSLIRTIETAEQPILIHCRAGVDRTGAASTMAAMAIGKENYDTAKWQSYVPPGPWKRNRENDYVHISDMFKIYERQHPNHKTAADDWQDFKQWSTVTDAIGDTDTKYRTDYSYLTSQKADWLRPISKLLRGTWEQFSVMLAILFVSAVLMYRRMAITK